MGKRKDFAERTSKPSEEEFKEFLNKTRLKLAKTIETGERKYRKFVRNKITFQGIVRGIGPYQTIEFKSREGRNELEIPVSFRLDDKVKITIEKKED